ncbi:unnamed protein product [Cuscuta epithymum]|uniref:Protein CHAPERONE-LIKE PROTEIN OF POR1, chloroplastic n=1 Tax=Cuscuta epithymum TaxID=186058 RepID=A0AAV0D135_9ASTE|nr:unnamed protein product [Cuscuta epithymum]
MHSQSTMIVPGLTASPLRYSFHPSVRCLGFPTKNVLVFTDVMRMRRNDTRKFKLERNHLVKCSMSAYYEDSMGDAGAHFPRINITDPYKRLGISREASEEEIQSARNFLIKKYAGHKPSVDSIESAHDKIIMQKFYERKNPKINIKKKVKEFTQSKSVQVVASRFRTPATSFLIKTSIAFVVIGAMTVLFPTEEGPTLQVAISLITTLYFIHARLRSKLRAFLYGVGGFIFSWLLGTFLMVSLVPPILKGPRSLEVTTSLITYFLLWVASTYLI